MKKLRLLITEKCNRNCSGCCNKDYDINNLPVFNFTDAKYYREIILTGGEPMLYPESVISIINTLKCFNLNRNIYLYTAKTTPTLYLLSLLLFLDGLTITLHDNSDIQPFLNFNFLLEESKIQNKSLRLNVFKNVKFLFESDNWIIKRNIEWIKNCPLPEDEVFMRLNKTL